jgi:spore maturation protein CgeB
VEHPAERAAKAQAGYQDAINKFTWEISARKAIKAFEEILNNIPARPLRLFKRYF